MKYLKELMAGLQFFTTLPININLDYEEIDLSETNRYYPIIGLITGLIVIGMMFLFKYMGPNGQAAIGLTTGLIINGGLHYDGLADVFDGFFANKDREQTILIMKDSHIGSFGVTALIIVTLLKYTFYSGAIVKSPLIILFSIINSRIANSIQSFGPIIPESSFGKSFQRLNFNILDLIINGIYILTLLFINITYIVPFIMMIIFTFIIKAYSNKKIGGVNGDIMGATCELTEIISLISFLGVVEWL